MCIRDRVFVKLVDYSDRKRSAMQIAAALNGMLYEGLPEAEGFALSLIHI